MRLKLAEMIGKRDGIGKIFSRGIGKVAKQKKGS
jgi:hypothetical protein